MTLSIVSSDAISIAGGGSGDNTVESGLESGSLISGVRGKVDSFFDG